MGKVMAQGRLKLTYDDYLGFPDDGRRHELIDGEHFVTAAPVLQHQRIVGELFEALRAAVRALGSGEVILSPMDVILSNHDVLQPDLLYVSAERARILRKWVHGAPDLAIEVLSPSSRRTDELRKRQRYELFGVSELWIVDPDVDVVRVYRREAADQGFGRSVELAAERGEALTTPLLPALSVPVASLFGAFPDEPDDADDAGD